MVWRVSYSSRLSRKYALKETTSSSTPVKRRKPFTNKNRRSLERRYQGLGENGSSHLNDYMPQVQMRTAFPEELAAMVAQYLPQCDIAACKLTSKALNNTFNPFFWKHFSVTNYKKWQWDVFLRTKEAECLYRNRQHIATLNLEIFAAAHLHALLNITSTRRADSAPSVPVQEPAGATPQTVFLCLKSISIAVETIQCGPLGKKDSVIPTNPLIRLLVSAPNITHLTFPVLSALPLLFAKPNLTTLGLDFYLQLTREDSPALVAKALRDLADNPKAQSAITSMVFPSMEDPFSILKPLLESCLPQLQILKVPNVGAQEIAQLSDIVRDHCPHVRELNLAILRDTPYPWTMSEPVARLIKSCRNLRVYHGPGSRENEDRGAITQALLHHASTLESLTLVEAMTSSGFASLISNMRDLRTLEADYKLWMDIKAVIAARWAPRRLQRLQLTIKVFDTSLDFVRSQKLHLDPELNPHSPSEELDQVGLGHVAMRKLLKNIGELTELEDLTLKYFYNSPWKFDKDWTLEGGLGFLGGLVRLRKLWVGHGVENVGQAEVEFMYEHWPKLEEVVFRIERSHLDRISQPWAWLKARRPHLKYTYKTFATKSLSRLKIFAAEHLYALLNITRTNKIDSAPSVPTQEPAGTAPQAGFLCLKSIIIAVGAIQGGRLSKMDSVIPTNPLIRLLVSAPNITHLTLYSEVLESAQFTATLKSDLHNLQTLILTRAQKFLKSLALVPVLSALRLLFAKPNLTTLELKFYLRLTPEDSPALVTKALEDLAENPKAKPAITSMVFPFMQGPLSILKPLLESCLPQLQILKVPYMGAQDVAQLSDIVRDHCPHVRELNLDELQEIRSTRAMSEQLPRLIKSCRNLRAYHGPYYIEDEDRAFAQALLQHANTLESVTVVGEMTMLGLRTLHIFYPLWVDVKDAVSARWAPQRLQRLDLTIGVFDTSFDFVRRQKLHLDPELNPHLPSEELDQVGLGHVALRKLFKNIGELTELEDLSLRYFYSSKWRFDKDWTLEVGLNFLGGLVRLRKLWLGHGAENIGQAEVEFMYKHWPKLEDVDIYIESSHLGKISQPWAWLKARRPHLRYTYNTFATRYAEPDSLDSDLDGY
ncbi:hypothetical protein BGZ70_005912 [Mortierella alpina]|uniref:F-box domain-containing protein n=1 Tax=Mortierella alpina TaxID=64518 RepID=A0A9P6J907_MORAP|nr:hypothetical protein BGZ70_005912 [Mortierella alpina]